jgi:type IV pilus assembly protein PilV
MQDATPRRHFAAGFTLVEALVALVVLSIGLLGVAALQFTSLKANHGSATRTQAVYLAYDIIDRMRANPAGANAHEYDVAYDATPAAGSIAGNDLIAWRQNIVKALPAGSTLAPTGSVLLNSTTNIVTVNIKWDDTHADVSNTTPPAGTLPQSDIVTFSVVTQLSN